MEAGPAIATTSVAAVCKFCSQQVKWTSLSLPLASAYCEMCGVVLDTNTGTKSFTSVCIIQVIHTSCNIPSGHESPIRWTISVVYLENQIPADHSLLDSTRVLCLTQSC